MREDIRTIREKRNIDNFANAAGKLQKRIRA